MNLQKTLVSLECCTDLEIYGLFTLDISYNYLVALIPLAIIVHNVCAIYKEMQPIYSTCILLFPLRFCCRTEGSSVSENTLH